MTKLILASQWISPGSQGGPAIHNRYLVEMLQDAFEWTVVSRDHKQSEEHYRSLKIPFIGVPKRRSWERLLSAIPRLKAYERFRVQQRHSEKLSDILLNYDSDLIEFIDINSEGCAFLEKKRKQKVVIRAHTPWALIRNTCLPSDIVGEHCSGMVDREKFCFDACDLISTPSENLKAQLVSIFALDAEKIHVIPNIVDTKHFAPIQATSPTPPIILHVGRFERTKGVITLTKAFAKLAHYFPSVHLVNVGPVDPVAFKTSIKLLEEVGLGHRVKFVGKVSYDDLPMYYSKARIVVMASEIYESFSYAVAQAMSCAKTVVASSTGGVNETIDNGRCGYLFTPASVESLTQTMCDAMRSTDLGDIGSSARAHVLKNYSFEILQSKYIELYDSVLRS